MSLSNIVMISGIFSLILLIATISVQKLKYSFKLHKRLGYALLAFVLVHSAVALYKFFYIYFAY